MLDSQFKLRIDSGTFRLPIRAAATGLYRHKNMGRWKGHAPEGHNVVDSFSTLQRRCIVLI